MSGVKVDVQVKALVLMSLVRPRSYGLTDASETYINHLMDVLMDVQMNTDL